MWTRLLDGVNVELIHLPPQGVTSWRCGLSPKFFDHLFFIDPHLVLIAVFKDNLSSPRRFHHQTTWLLKDDSYY